MQKYMQFCIYFSGKERSIVLTYLERSIVLTYLEWVRIADLSGKVNSTDLFGMGQDD